MLSDRVIRTTFIISLVGHCLFLGMPGFNFTSFQTKEQPEELKVQIEVERPALLPKIDVMGEEKKVKEVIENRKPSLEAPEPLFEEVVMDELLEESPEEIRVVDSAQVTMLRYQDMVKQRIEESRRYPDFAKRQGIEGVVYLSFVILADGSSEDIRIIRSSGSKILDDEAVFTIRRANPLPPIPREFNTSLIQMETALVFTLK